MTPSSQCIDLIKQFEGFRASPYLCPANIPTIGFGNTHYADGTAVSLQDTPITEAQAEDLLAKSLEWYAESVNRFVQVTINQNQFDALVDFAYNAGAQNLCTSTLLAKLNAGDFAGAADEFGKWVHGGGQILPGLVKRRAAERSLFLL